MNMDLYMLMWSRCLFCFLLIENSFVRAANLHTRLTKRELFDVFGSSSYSNIPNYEVAFFKSHSIHKRSIVPNDMFYRFHLNGENLTLHLYPNTQLLSPHFELKPDGLNVNITAAAECLYHGRILQSHSGRAAVSLCNGQGLTGFIETSHMRYQIQPVPARLQEYDEQGHMHVLVPKTPTNETGTFCGVHELNKPQKIVAGIGPEPLMYNTRNRRSDSLTDKLYIETAVFADYMLYRTLVGRTLLPDHDAFVKYVLAIVNTVQLIYNEPSLGRPVEIVLVRLEILQNENLPFYNEEVDKYLWDFCKWQNGLNPGTDLSTPGHWDHAIILTGFDLRSGNMRSVTGYAPVGGMCNPMYSCTINEGNHFGAAFVIAHEMGHSLTMQHDGQAGVSGNGCDAQSYLMSPSTGRGKTTWSACSRNYLDAFLMSSQSTCLKDVPPGRESAIDFYSGNLPGQLYPPDEQCRLLYGIEFHRYNMQPDADVCEILICANSTVYITGHPALPGTYCGQGHWCSGGECLPWGALGPISVDGGWSAWPASAKCTANCLLPGTGVRIFDRGCTNPLPSNGGKQCEGKSKRYRTCEQASLCDKKNITTIPEYANRQCSFTKTNQNDLTLSGSGRQRIQDPTGGCVVWCDTVQGGYKTWGSKFPDGTDCSGGSGKAFCLDGQCQPFGCDGWTLDESSPGSCQPSTKTSTTTSTTSTPSYILVGGEDTSNAINTHTPATVPPKTLLFPDQNPFYAMVDQSWGAWETSGPCTASCIQNSTGIRQLARKCMDPTGICFGRNTTIAKCSAVCPKIFVTAEAYVIKICSALKTIDHGLTGRGRQLPHSPTDNRQACKLWCEKESTLRSWPDMYFPDGTMCHTVGTSASYCYKGICTNFACDGKAAATADTAKCDEPKVILSDEASGKLKTDHTLNKSSIIAIDVPISGSIPTHNASDFSDFKWMIMSSPCSEPCGGGTRKNFVQCTHANAGPAKGGHKVEEINCDAENKPSVPLEEICNTESCPVWSASGWKDCTVECGNGTQARLVQCVRVGTPIGNVTVETILEDTHCDLFAKPVTAQICLKPPCFTSAMISGVN